MNLEQVLTNLADNGLLLLSDKSLPSVVGLVAGPKIKGSWWGHERGHDIFRMLGRLEDHPDVLTTRLVSGKVTYVHRRIWPDFLSAANSRESWQTNGLSSQARHLLSSVMTKGEIRMDQYQSTEYARESRDAAREIERRLLVYTEEIHTESGTHAKVIKTWSRCSKVQGVRFQPRAPRDAKRLIEKLVDDLNSRYHGLGILPWRQ